MKNSMFSHWSIRYFFYQYFIFSKNEDSDFELDDDDIDKILIITPTPPSNRKHHQKNHEHTGEHTPRARMTAEVARIIDAGLRRYEAELWRPDRSAETVKSTSQEEMNAVRNQSRTNTEKKISHSPQSQAEKGKCLIQHLRLIKRERISSRNIFQRFSQEASG